jgi:hypothetical protein
MRRIQYLLKPLLVAILSLNIPSCHSNTQLWNDKILARPQVGVHMGRSLWVSNFRAPMKNSKSRNKLDSNLELIFFAPLYMPKAKRSVRNRQWDSNILGPKICMWCLHFWHLYNINFSYFLTRVWPIDIARHSRASLHNTYKWLKNNSNFKNLLIRFMIQW